MKEVPPINTQPSTPRQPEASFRYGACSASVFVNEATRKDGTRFTVRRVVLQRSYQDEAGTWRTTNSLDVNDVPKAVLCLQDAYRHSLSAGRNPREPGDEG
jgi:hypothetical protein